MKLRDRSRTRSRERTEAHEEDYVYKYVSLVAEFPHPLKKVPGIKHCRWEASIGRWVKV